MTPDPNREEENKLAEAVRLYEIVDQRGFAHRVSEENYNKVMRLKNQVALAVRLYEVEAYRAIAEAVALEETK